MVSEAEKLRSTSEADTWLGGSYTWASLDCTAACPSRSLSLDVLGKYGGLVHHYFTSPHLSPRHVDLLAGCFLPVWGRSKLKKKNGGYILCYLTSIQMQHAICCHCVQQFCAIGSLLVHMIFVFRMPAYHGNNILFHISKNRCVELWVIPHNDIFLKHLRGKLCLPVFIPSPLCHASCILISNCYYSVCLCLISHIPIIHAHLLSPLSYPISDYT